MATVPEAETPEARLAALRQDPSVVIHQRATREPFQPVIQVTEQVDILELIGRRDEEAVPQPPE